MQLLAALYRYVVYLSLLAHPQISTPGHFNSRIADAAVFAKPESIKIILPVSTSRVYLVLPYVVLETVTQSTLTGIPVFVWKKKSAL